MFGSSEGWQLIASFPLQHTQEYLAAFLTSFPGRQAMVLADRTHASMRVRPRLSGEESERWDREYETLCASLSPSSEAGD